MAGWYSKRAVGSAEESPGFTMADNRAKLSYSYVVRLPLKSVELVITPKPGSYVTDMTSGDWVAPRWMVSRVG
jgi:hypothetical protein